MKSSRRWRTREYYNSALETRDVRSTTRKRMDVKIPSQKRGICHREFPGSGTAVVMRRSDELDSSRPFEPIGSAKAKRSNNESRIMIIREETKWCPTMYSEFDTSLFTSRTKKRAAVAHASQIRTPIEKKCTKFEMAYVRLGINRTPLTFQTKIDLKWENARKRTGRECASIVRVWRARAKLLASPGDAIYNGKDAQPRGDEVNQDIWAERKTMRVEMV